MEKEESDILRMGSDGSVRRKNKVQTILVVEDDRVHSLLIEEILEQIGYAVIPAENADTALRKLKWQGPNIDLVLLDYEMPDMTGIDTVREIRRGEKSGAWAHVPVIGFSSNNDPKKRERCLAAGMDDYLSKDTFLPRWRGSLEGVIKKWIGSSDFVQKETEERKEEEGKKE